MTGSKYVISWRKRTKQKMIKAFGDKCCVCSHTYPPEVFEFHHLNPKNKEFSLGKIRSNYFTWERIVNELRKCVMVCSNCHRLIENGYVEVPPDAKRFDNKSKNKKRKKTRRCSPGRQRQKDLKS